SFIDDIRQDPNRFHDQPRTHLQDDSSKITILVSSKDLISSDPDSKLSAQHPISPRLFTNK
ncbi:hypothetical protein NPIL_176651, partial [Nephila pilipes]